MSDAHNLKRPLLYLLVVSVILAVVLGIAIVLRNKWGWFEVSGNFSHADDPRVPASAGWPATYRE